MDGGAGRGALNQGAVAMQAFRGSLHIGTGIQNGDFDWKNNIGPAAAEIVRLEADLGKGAQQSGRPEPVLFVGAAFPVDDLLHRVTHEKVQFGDAIKVGMLPEHGGNERGKRPRRGEHDDKLRHLLNRPPGPARASAGL
jgi:hypothetical protein